MNLDKDKQLLVDRILYDLIKIRGVRAIVLGGSYAIGMATENSDIDLGIYYSSDEPFDISEIKAVGEKYAEKEPPIVTGFYEWGPWVNGGAWIKARNCKVDFVYKNIEQIDDVINKARTGIWQNDFEQQPPYGFSSVTFLAETNYCISLYDRDGIIAALKAKVVSYPQQLKKSVIQYSLWSAEFTIWQGENFAAKNDIYNTTGCLTRATNKIIVALFALNELYPLGDKRALNILEEAKLRPKNFTLRVNEVLRCEGDNLKVSITKLRQLFTETVNLAQGLYTSFYKLQ